MFDRKLFIKRKQTIHEARNLMRKMKNNPSAFTRENTEKLNRLTSEIEEMNKQKKSAVETGLDKRTTSTYN